MEQKTDRFYPSAPLENNDPEQRREKNEMMLTVLITISITLQKRLLTLKTKK